MKKTKGKLDKDISKVELKIEKLILRHFVLYNEYFLKHALNIKQTDKR